MGLFMIVNGGKITTRKTGGQYDGEKIPGDLDAMVELSTDPNYIVESTYEVLQKRSMTLYHTHPFTRGAVNKQVDYGIGPGLAFRSQPDYSMLGWDKNYAKDWGKDFQKIVHYFFQEFNFYEKQPVMFRGALTLGDSFLDFDRDDKGRLTDLIEFGGDQIDCNYKKAGYTLGIKHDTKLRKQGVKTIEGDDVAFQNSASDQQIVQFYLKELPRQLRGMPLAYSVINFCKQDDRHMDATTKRAVMEAILFAFFKSDGTTDISRQADNLEDIGEETKRGNAFTRVLERIGSKKMPAGSLVQMGTGESMGFSDLKTPSGQFDVFKTWILNYIGAATGTPPEVILSKYSTSYTAHRGALNDFEKSYMYKRRVFERKVLYPVIREIAKEAILQGLIKAPGFFDGHPIIQRAYLQGMTLGPVPGVINPLQEVGAYIKSVDGAFRLRSDIAALFGNEWDNMIEEWKAEQEEFQSASPEKRAEIIQEQEEAKGGQSDEDDKSDR